jgi:zinc transport system substrate-binding protein
MRVLFLFFLLVPSILLGKSKIIVSILPQKTFVEKIAQNTAEITVMVTPGVSPHTYEPKVSQMLALSKADIYFSIGVEFENIWLDKFRAQNQNLSFIDMSEGIKKIHMLKYADNQTSRRVDPHIWTSPDNVAQMAKTIYHALVKLNPQHTKAYQDNLEQFLEEIKQTDKQVKTHFQNLGTQRSFMVFHPAWGYFARAYGLKQIPVEVEGKHPKPKEIIHVIKKAKEEKVRVIFIQPEFSDKSARIIAQESGVSIQKISPLNPDWSTNLLFMAQSIANQ